MEKTPSQPPPSLQRIRPFPSGSGPVTPFRIPHVPRRLSTTCGRPAVQSRPWTKAPPLSRARCPATGGGEARLQSFLQIVRAEQTRRAARCRPPAVPRQGHSPFFPSLLRFLFSLFRVPVLFFLLVSLLFFWYTFRRSNRHSSGSDFHSFIEWKIGPGTGYVGRRLRPRETVVPVV